MTDKVQKIKDWISKEQDGLMDAQGNFGYPEHEGAYHILCNLDAYIDSLQEEPVSEEWIKELRTKLDSMSKEDFKKVFDKYAVDFNEEPISKELEKAANEWNAKASFTPFYMALDDKGRPNGVRRNYTTHAESFKAGAKWQKLQDMGITNKAQDVVANVLSSADNPLDAYATEVAFIMLPATLKESYHQTNRDRIGDAVKLGAKWQKEKDDEEKVLTYKHGFNDCKEHINEALLSEVLPCFMHGGEADEVVAKLDEVLNQKK